MEQMAQAALMAIKTIDAECSNLVKERNQLKKQLHTGGYDRSNPRDREYIREVSIHQAKQRWDI